MQYKFLASLFSVFVSNFAFAECNLETGNALYFPGAAAKSNVVMQAPLAIQASTAIFKGLNRSAATFSMPVFGKKDIITMTSCPPVIYSGNLVHALGIYKTNLTVIAQAKNDNEGALALPPNSKITSFQEIGSNHAIFAVPYSITEGMVAGYLVKQGKIGEKGARLFATADQSRALQAITPTDETGGKFQYKNTFFISIGQSLIAENMIVVARKQAIINYNKTLVASGKEKYQLKILDNPQEFSGPGPSIYASSQLTPAWVNTIAKNVFAEGFSAQYSILDNKDGYVPVKPSFQEQLSKLQSYEPLLEAVRGK
jgi:hypothetical protein